MHLSVLNDPDLLLGLWRGTLKCYPPDDVSTWDWAVLKDKKIWKAHGDSIEAATPFIPSSFGRAPRNPADKINSGYKAWEFQLYIYGLGPVLLRHILPQRYWEHYCKLVSGIQVLQRPEVTPDDLRYANIALKDFVRDFEALYYQHKACRIHFVRHSVHLLTHIAPETVRAGPLSCYAQWTMETAIGNLGKEIRQDKDPYRNLEERGVIRAQINSLMAMYPTLNINYGAHGLSIHAHEFPDGFAFLPRCDSTARPMARGEYDALMIYWQHEGWPNRSSWPNVIFRWARLQLPNGQRARSIWSESNTRTSLRQTSCVEINYNGNMRIANVLYYFYLQFQDQQYPLAVVNLFSFPDTNLLSKSSQTVYICDALEGQDAIQVIAITSIKSVVSMFPDLKVTPGGEVVNTQRFALLRHPFIRLEKYNTGGLFQEDDDNGTGSM
ncbi:hypothetical protein BC826DRAFT_921758 [Russula brevipes]|nr:hypothetical protein BC826DRAFT_921758 [Russula brevipes]